jgi:selenocysteine-specific elongation factor
LQFTLVDCPGHASLIKTIIGGAQIIDIMFLIIDVTKGIQAQTAECVIIAELFMKKIIVVLNKVDLVEDKKVLDAKTLALRKIFSKTKFG